jgi:hypothetical protein
VRGELSEKRRRDACVRWSSPEIGEMVARRSNSPGGDGLGAPSGLRASTEGGGLRRVE